MFSYLTTTVTQVRTTNTDFSHRTTSSIPLRFLLPKQNIQIISTQVPPLPLLESLRLLIHAEPRVAVGLSATNEGMTLGIS
jgi:hypothetical protein